jgi:hypothetical protein
MSENIRMERVPASGSGTCYRVLLNNEPLGYVFCRRGFSYRGTEGWNRGIRLRDFHPWEWCTGQNNVLADTDWHRTRKDAVEYLVAERQKH